MGARGSHLAGQPHAKKARAAATTATIDRSITAITTSTRWTCNICDKTMAIGSKEGHLAGKPHAAQNSARATATIDRRRRVTAVPTRWTCTVCDRTMLVGSKESHLAGRPHNDLCLDGKEAQEDMSDTDSEEEENYSHSSWKQDQEDARSIAYAIDTQWGMMPQGGAYKDSARYLESYAGSGNWIEY